MENKRKKTKEELLQEMRAKKKEEISNKTRKERDEKCIPLARQIVLDLFESSELPLGSGNDQKVRFEFFQNIAKDKMLPLLLEKDLTLYECTYVFRLIFECIKGAEDMVVESLKDSISRFYEIKIGVDTDNITLSMVDKTLKEDYERKKEKIDKAVENPKVDKNKE